MCGSFCLKGGSSKRDIKFEQNIEVSLDVSTRQGKEFREIMLEI